MEKLSKWFTSKVEYTVEGEKGPLATKELLKAVLVSALTYFLGGWVLVVLIVLASLGAALTKHYFGD